MVATRLVRAVGQVYLGAGCLNEVGHEIRGGATAWPGNSIVRVFSSRRGYWFDERRVSFVLDELVPRGRGWGSDPKSTSRCQ